MNKVLATLLLCLLPKPKPYQGARFINPGIGDLEFWYENFYSTLELSAAANENKKIEEYADDVYATDDPADHHARVAHHNDMHRL